MLILLLVICGIYAFHKNKISSYLFLRTRFVFIDFSQPVVWTLMEYLFVSILFMIIGYGFWQVCTRHTSKTIFKTY